MAGLLLPCTAGTVLHCATHLYSNCVSKGLLVPPRLCWCEEFTAELALSRLRSHQESQCIYLHSNWAQNVSNILGKELERIVDFQRKG